MRKWTEESIRRLKENGVVVKEIGLFIKKTLKGWEVIRRVDNNYLTPIPFKYRKEADMFGNWWMEQIIPMG